MSCVPFTAVNYVLHTLAFPQVNEEFQGCDKTITATLFQPASVHLSSNLEFIHVLGCMVHHGKD